MRHQYRRWHSSSLQGEMELLERGHHGAPMIGFSVVNGDVLRVRRSPNGAGGRRQARRRRVAAVLRRLGRGRKLVHRRADPRHQVRRHLRYDAYTRNTCAARPPLDGMVRHRMISAGAPTNRFLVLRDKASRTRRLGAAVARGILVLHVWGCDRSTVGRTGTPWRRPTCLKVC